MLKSIEVRVSYKGKITSITKKKFEEIFVSEGIDFINFLAFVFQSYPEIEGIFSPGSIALTLNGEPPKTKDILQAGDLIEFSTE